MQRLEVSGVVRPIYRLVRPICGSLGVKRLTTSSWQADTDVSKDLAVSFLGLKQFYPEIG